MSTFHIVDDNAGNMAVYADGIRRYEGGGPEGEQLGVLSQIGLTVCYPILDDRDDHFPATVSDLRFGEPTPPAGTIEDLMIVDDESGYYGFYLAGDKIAMTEALDHAFWEALEVPVRAMAMDALADDEDFPAQLSDLMLKDPAKPYLHGGLARLGANEDQMRRYHQLHTEFEGISDIDQLEVGADGAVIVEVFDGMKQEWQTVSLFQDGAVVPDILSA